MLKELFDAIGDKAVDAASTAITEYPKWHPYKFLLETPGGSVAARCVRSTRGMRHTQSTRTMTTTTRTWTTRLHAES